MSHRKYLVLWIDDEPHHMRYHLDALHEDVRLDVVLRRGISEAFTYIDAAYVGDVNAPALVIWDLVMPSGKLPLDVTREGLRTGELFYDKLRTKFRSVPAILFTNAVYQDVHERYNALDNNSWAFHKRDLMPDQLLLKVLEILGLGNPMVRH